MATSDVSQLDQSNQEGVQRQGVLFQRRPRFLRSLTSPMPTLRDTDSPDSHPSTSSSLLHSVMDPSSHFYPSTVTCAATASRVLSPSTVVPALGALQEHTSPRPIRPQVQPIQMDQHACDPQKRSFSTTSMHPSLLPPPQQQQPGSSASTPSIQTKSSITESLKEHRWSKVKLNWPSFGGNNSSNSGSNSSSSSNNGGSSGRPSPGLEGPTTSRSSQRPVQRRKSEGTSLRIAKPDQGVDSSISGPSLGLAPVSISGKTFAKTGKAGMESSVDHLKVSEARTRRISDSGLSVSSKLAGTGLAEKLSGFAQTVRGLSRSSFNPGGQSSPTMTTSSTCSTPTSPGFSPVSVCSLDLGKGGDQGHRIRNISFNKAYESWDDFLFHYRQGHFPGDCTIPRPKTTTLYPPTPPSYLDSHLESLPYLAAPLPPNEEHRLRALHSFQILQTGIDPNFERIVQLVATVMGVAGCVITLVDHFQVSIKAQHPAFFGEGPREQSFCAHTILRPSDDPMIILDTKADWRFRNLPGVVSAPGIRFYAGAPLTTLEGLNIGALCLVDFEPRSSFTEKERTLLVDFAAVVMREMELWNDQVQLCTRNRMMRDVTRWVRGRLDTSTTETLSDSDPPTRDFRHGESNVLNLNQQPLPTPSDVSASSSGLDMGPGPALISPPLEPVFPTPSGSPKLMSCALAPTSTAASQATLGSTRSSTEEPSSAGNQLYDTAFPNACIVIQATLDVDAVYLVHASANQSVIPTTGSSVVWNYLDAAGRRKGSVGVVKGGQVFSDRPSSALTYLASSRKDPKIFTRPIYDEKYQHTKRKGSCWVCTDEGCRPHQLGRELLGATEPVWERDLPIIKEMLAYVREELPEPSNVGGGFPLYTYSAGQDAIENDWFAGSPDLYPKHPRSRKLLCHTFQGTLPALRAGANTPYQSATIVPVLGPSSNTSDEEPWAYFVILSSSRNKEISFHERIYLKNFGSCLVTEVQRRRIEAADKAKGVFIKSISHELRTPLHIILGILELLCANPEEPLSETQRAMVVTAENSGNLLNDTINNIIDLAKLDPDNTTECVKKGDGSLAPLPVTDDSVMEEVDIRELCQKVAEQMAKACTDKNVVVIPSWTKPSLTSLSSSVSATAAAGASAANFGSVQSVNGYTSSSESLSSFSTRRLRNERKAILELMVALDEPERDPDQDTAWNFVFDVTSMTRILKQLVENAIKFTTTGFVELSAVPLTNSPLPMKPPHPDAQAILFTVRDTGKGISADFVQSHLFKRFTQEDPLQTGTGLGMALVKEYIRKLGGWMEVWSEGVEGKGCVVKVLIWAKPALNQTKSLKDIAGPWQDASCRFYCGESTVGSERLFKILGERMMGQQLNMNVERGDEQDVCAEDMLKDLADHSRCDLLVFNDDLGRLKTYLSYWTEYHHKVKAEGIKDPKTPTPLLILVAPPHVKDVQPLIDEYLETQIDNSSIERPASIVIMTKPIGPIKLMQCLRECFTPAFADPGRQTPPPEGSTHVRSGSQKLPPMPLLRSATAPNIPTVALGSRLMPGGGMMKQSMMYPVMTHGEMRPGMVLIPPHSPGGLVIPPRILSSVGISPVSTPEHEHYSSYYGSTFDGHHGILDPFPLVHPRLDAGTNGGAHSSDPGGSTGKSLTKPRSQRSIKDYHAQRPRPGKPATTTTAETSTAEASTSSPPSSKSSEPVAQQEDGAPEKPLPRVLIVEDNITNRMILRTFLKKRGIEFVEAENGKLGVERFQEEVWRRGGKAGFEFVLMDLQMPVMDGNVATRQIREFEYSMMKQAELANSLNNNNPSSESAGSTTSSSMDPIPEHGEESFAGGYRPSIIFALTGLAGEEDKRLAFECGVDGYLTKPVSLKTLGTLMSNCLPENMEGLTLFNPVDTKVQA